MRDSSDWMLNPDVFQATNHTGSGPLCLQTDNPTPILCELETGPRGSSYRCLNYDLVGLKASANPTSLDLTEEDNNVLVDNRCLSDKHMDAAAKMLKTQFPEVKGFQSTVPDRFIPAMENPSYQFHHCNSH